MEKTTIISEGRTLKEGAKINKNNHEGKSEIVNNPHKEYEHKDHEYKKASEEEIENCKKNIEEFLNKFLKEFENLKYEINKNDDMLSIVISGDDAGKLIGYRGDVINALQTILSAI